MTSAAPARRGLWAALGPGVLFTGAAVGVSHIVQSTRAGAVYGGALIIVIVLANLLKYPAFRFGPQYAAATGTSLLEGYRRQGRWALTLYGLLTVGTMFTVQAAVTLVTAGLAKYLFGLSQSPLVISAVIVALCAGFVAVGRYRWLDVVSKVVVSLLALSTIAAFVIALPSMDFGGLSWWPGGDAFEPAGLMFVAALVGWMPSAIDIAVWQSLWTLARQRDTGHRPTMAQSMTDFHLGYVGTAFLAVCFLLLGAAVMFGSGVELQDRPAAFAGQIVDLYGQTLGAWSRPLIAACALATMFSTTLTVVDGFPRALSVLTMRFREPERAGRSADEERKTRYLYWGSVAVLAVGSLLVIAFLMDSFKTLIDVATTLSFLTAPILAVLNHRAVLGPEVPEADRPSPALRALSWTGIVALSAFALYYLSLLLP